MYQWSCTYVVIYHCRQHHIFCIYFELGIWKNQRHNAWTRITAVHGRIVFGNVLRYSLLCISIVFVIFFGLFSGTYFYKHCLKQTFITNNRSDYQISNQQEGCNSHYHGRHLERDNTIDPYYLEPVSSAHYEEVVNYVNPDDII